MSKSAQRKIVEQYAKIAELEAENAGLRIALSRQGKSVMPEVIALRNEVARLRGHIRAIAEHHDHWLGICITHEPRDIEQYHTERRDFALSVLEENDHA